LLSLCVIWEEKQGPASKRDDEGEQGGALHKPTHGQLPWEVFLSV